jgi:hypothetical protein
LDLTDKEILELPRMDSPVMGGHIYFKTMFLHPLRYEPVVAWRWGRIIDVKGSDVTIDILGPKYQSGDDELEDGEVEEGEIESREEIFGWTGLLDARQRVE